MFITYAQTYNTLGSTPQWVWITGIITTALSTILCPIIAAAKNRNFIGWIFGGFLLGLLGLIIICILPTAESEVVVHNIYHDSNKIDNNPNMLIKCPACGKYVSKSAFSCPHCGHPITKELISQIETEQQSSKETKLEPGYAVFVSDYFGRDADDNTVHILPKTQVKIIRKNDDFTYDIEYENKEIKGVQPHYLRSDTEDM